MAQVNGLQSTETNQVSNMQQMDNGASTAVDVVVTHPEDRMMTPPPVAGQSFPMAFTSEGRANYLRYGVTFTPAYTDNALFGISQVPVSDVSYSVAPVIAIDESTSRLRWVASYAPGFTFYQRISDRNEADHNATLQLSYRLSPHVTFSAEDRFQKSSNALNQPNFGSAFPVSGAAQVPNLSVVAPVADRLSNTGTVSLSYQYALNQMVGASGMFAHLDYPNPSQVPGLFNSSSQAGSTFYSFRVSKAHYLGAIYQYQRLLAYPTQGQSETQTHAALFFYTFYPSPHFSLSFFGGPQYSDTSLPPFPPEQPSRLETKDWNPAAGASLNWQGRRTSLALSYSRVIAGGSGLTGAVHTDNASASVRQQITRTLTGAIDGAYAQNRVITISAPQNVNGHSVLGTASLQQQIGAHLNIQVGYTRMHQSYGQVAILSGSPDTNREFISISYQFSKSLGR